MRIGIIGRFADGKELLDGQTIKTKILRDELRKKKSNYKVRIADVYNFKIKFFLIYIRIFFLFIKSDVIIVLLSKNGRRILFPYIYFLNKIFKRKMYHDVIGGKFVDDILCNNTKKKHLLAFTEHWVETESMKNKLKEYGIENVDVIPNFKPLAPIDIKDVYSLEEYRFCTFSRVTKAKGITDAIEAIAKINENIQYKVTLDIYGIVEDSYREEFNNFIKK